MHTVMVTSKGYEAWKQGELIQRALPELSASDRELLISQTCPKCWDEMFDEEDEIEKQFNDFVDERINEAKKDMPNHN